MSAVSPAIKAARFWVKVSITEYRSQHVNSKCWEYDGPFDKDGYGKHGYGRAHRVAWECAFGQIPAGRAVLHKCDNPPCCNPHHLFLGDIPANNFDKVAKGRDRAPQGIRHGRHKLTDGQVRAIRDDPRTQREVAAEYGVSRSLISLIKNRRNWSHLA